MPRELRQKKHCRWTKKRSSSQSEVSGTQWKKNDDLLLNVREISRMPYKHNDENALQKTVDGMNSDDDLMQLAATRACIKLMEKAKEPLINNMISKGIIPRCVAFLSFHNNSALQSEALQILAHLTYISSENTMTLIRYKVVPKLVMLLKSPANNVAENAVWTLSNIAGDCPEARDNVLKENCTPLLLNLIQPNTSVIFATNIVRTCANLCDNYDPPPSAETVNTSLKIFNRLITVKDEEIHLLVCRALLSLTERENSNIQAVIDSDVISKIMPLLASQRITVVTSALKVLKNIASGTDSQANSIINSGGLERLKLLLEHKNAKIVQAAASIITHIFAGTYEQVQHIINTRIFLPLYNVLVQVGGVSGIANLVDDGSIRIASPYLQKRLLEPFCRLLACDDRQTTARILDHLMRAFNETGIKQDDT